MQDSQQLLADYAACGSDAAFQELVRRHLDMVYSTAVRLTQGDTQLAEDVAQIVFIDLARKAQVLPPSVNPGGWLHRHTCFVASKLIRSECRRRLRERQAAEMNSLHNDTELDLAQITPILDNAINQLRPADRATIIMRYFEGRDFRAVGAALGASENAAQKRLVHALEKLRVILKRRGVVCSATVLGSALASQMGQSAPPGLTVGIARTALLNAAAKASIAQTALKIMAQTNLKTAAAAVVIVASLLTPVVVRQQAQVRLRDQERVLQRQSSLLIAPKNKQTGPDAPVPDDHSTTLSENQFRDLLRLRGEMAALRRRADTLRRAKATRDSDALLTASQVWPAREIRLKHWLDEHPSEKIPELSRLPDKSWINSIYPNALETDDDCRRAVTVVRDNAEAPTRIDLAGALRRYAAAQNGQWPSEISQLGPYLDPPLDSAVLNRYSIVPASSLAAELQTGDEWALTETAPINEYDDRFAIGLTNSTFANKLVTNRWGTTR